uniref:MULE transposase domain-containing protein n=1 Tax=Plectus sambesii TaxID=2011161 RepID=A0A914WU39_9BILA
MTTLAYKWGQSQRKGGSRKLITPAPPSTEGVAQVHTWTRYRGAYVVEGEEKRLFRCTKCQRIKEHSEGTYPVPSLRMANVGQPGERMEVEPSAVLGKHFCLPLKRSAVVGDQLYLEQRELVAMSGKRAMKAHMDALQAVETSRFALVTEVERNEARDQMANERTRKRGYQRARKDKYRQLPRSRRFRMRNIDSLHRSAHWVLDGNFKYRPAGMQQLYSIHGFVQAANGEYEAKTLVAAIMKSRTAKMYERMFGVVRAQLIERFGHIGAMGAGGRAHFDFEPAALTAFEAVFGPNLTNMCLFHYTNCVNKKIQGLGLSTTYQECRFINRFVRKMVALCMLNVDHVLKAFKLVCTVPLELDGNEECPCRDIPHAPLPLGTEDKLGDLRAYFEKLGLFDASTGALLPVGGTMLFSWKEWMCSCVAWVT